MQSRCDQSHKKNTYTCMYVCIYVYIHIHRRICIHPYIYTCIIYTYTYIYIHIHRCLFDLFIHAYVYVRMGLLLGIPLYWGFRTRSALIRFLHYPELFRLGASYIEGRKFVVKALDFKMGGSNS